MIKSSLTGSALILTALAIAAMTTVIIGVAQLVPKDFRQVQALESSLRAETAAWAGIEHALLLLRSAQNDASFFETSQRGNPASRYTPFGGVNCLFDRANQQCAGVDRQLGAITGDRPKLIEGTLDDESAYQLLTWHRREDVGNPQDIYDELLASSPLNTYPSQANINPVLARDEVRRLDMRGVSNGSAIILRWQLIANSSCAAAQADTRAHLLYAWMTPSGELMPSQGSRGLIAKDSTQVTLTKPEGSAILSLRLLLSHPQDEVIRGCFARYSLDNQGGETSDMGFDVVESTGVSGGVRRKIRVIVNRENGRLLNVFDFGFVCADGCTGLE